jgi:hypothetical protein
MRHRSPAGSFPNRQEHVNFARRETRDSSFVRCLDVVECKIPAFLIAEFGHPLEEICIKWGLSRLHTDKADTQHPWLLLRSRRERPRRCRAAEQGDELATFQLVEAHTILQDVTVGSAAANSAKPLPRSLHDST